jgi:hypothetical protein
MASGKSIKHKKRYYAKTGICVYSKLFKWIDVYYTKIIRHGDSYGGKRHPGYRPRI